MKKRIAPFLLKIKNLFVRTETVNESKKKWSELARKNAKYYIWSEKENATEEEFRESGRRDYKKYIKDDPLLQENLERINARNILEIGCGIGRMTEFFGDDFEKVFGIDISSEMIKRAKKRLPGDKFVLLEGNGVELPVGFDPVDFTFSFIVFQHMPSLEMIASNFKEVFRVLRPGGIFKVQLRGNETSRKKWFYGESFTVDGAKKLAHTTGFEILKTEKETERYLWLWLVKPE